MVEPPNNSLPRATSFEMDEIIHFILRNPSVAISLAFAFLCGFFLLRQWLLGHAGAYVPSLVIPTPEACKPDWKGEQLQNPSIKVGSQLHWISGPLNSSNTRPVLRILLHPMLLPSKRTAPRNRQAHKPRGNRSRDRRSKGSTEGMGEDKFRGAEARVADASEVRSLEHSRCERSRIDG